MCQSWCGSAAINDSLGKERSACGSVWQTSKGQRYGSGGSGLQTLMEPRDLSRLGYAFITCAAALLGWSLLSRVKTHARARIAASAASQAISITMTENVSALPEQGQWLCTSPVREGCRCQG